MSLSIGIAGGGIAGLAAALALAGGGHRVSVFDRFERPRAVGAGLLLQPTGQAALAALGLLAEIRATASPIARLDSRTVWGWPVLDLHYARLRPGLHGLGVHRARLFGGLLSRLQGAGVELVTGTEIAAAEIDGTLATDTGARHRFDLAVVADGAHSALRGALGQPARERLYPWGCLWATVPLRGIAGDALHQRVKGTRVMIGVLPVGVPPGAVEPHAALFWSLPNRAVARFRAAPFALFQQRLARLWPAAGGLLAPLQRHEQMTHATYRDVRLLPAARGRCVVIGDAAHATSPQLGQGANLALGDAVGLADALAGAGAGDVAEALARFEARRRPVWDYYGRASRLLTPIFQSRVPGLGLVRDLGAPFGRLAFMDRLMLTTLAGLRTGFLPGRAVEAPECSP